MVLMTATVPVGEAKSQLSELLRRVEGGEEIIIRRGSRSIARLVPERPTRIAAPGALSGRIRMSDDFDAPLEDFDGYRVDPS